MKSLPRAKTPQTQLLNRACFPRCLYMKNNVPLNRYKTAAETSQGTHLCFCLDEFIKTHMLGKASKGCNKRC